MSGQPPPPPPPPPPNPASVTAPHFAPAGSTSTSTSTTNPNTASAANHDPGQMSQTTAAAVATRGTPATLNLDDIFGDCFFTPEGDAVFMNDQPGAAAGGAAGGGSGGGSGSTGMGINMDGSGIVGSAEAVPTRMASRPAAAAAATTDPAAAAAAGGEPQYQPVSYGGGIATTNLDNPNKSIRSTVMGRPAPTAAPAASANAGSSALSSSSTSAASSANSGSIPPTKAVPFVQPPQQRHHLQYATPAMLGAARAQAQNAAQAHQASVTKRKSGGGVVHATGGAGGGSGGGGSGGGGRGERKMSDKQKVERRERNREHAKRSRIRKKFLLESLQQSVALLKDENDKLRSSIRQHLGDEADELLKKENLAEAAANGGGAGGLIAGSSADANKVLDDPDFSFIKALQTAQQNFVVTDPSLPDNPIVYATQGFLNLTGYTLDQVLGRNCRFLQGPETDPKAVEKIRRAIEEGSDMSVCLLNYRVDGSTFWNQFFIAALRDAAGNITNYVGVQCKVSDQYAANVCKRQEEADRATVAGSAADPPPGQSQPQGGMEAMGDPQQQQQAAMAAPPAAPAAPPSAPAPVAASS